MQKEISFMVVMRYRIRELIIKYTEHRIRPFRPGKIINISLLHYGGNLLQHTTANICNAGCATKLDYAGFGTSPKARK